MTGDKLSFLDEVPLEEPAVEPEVTEPEPEAEPEKAEQPRDPETGKFAPKDKGETTAAPPAAEPKEDKHLIPVAVAQDDRRKRQQAEEREKRLEAELQEMRRQQAQMAQWIAAQQQPKPQAPPDPLQEPEAYGRHIQTSTQQEMRAMLIRQSQFFAERDFGKDVVAETMAYLNQQPWQVGEQFLNAPSPYHAAVEYYQKQKALAEIGPDVGAYRERILAEERAKWEAETRAKLREEVAAEIRGVRPTPPPQSLAQAPSSGTDKTPLGTGSGFDQAFAR